MIGLIATLPFLFLAQAPGPANVAAAPVAPVTAAPAAPVTAAPAQAPAAAPAATTTTPAAGQPVPPGGPGAPAPQPSPFSTLIPLLPIPILFYFLMIRPQQQQEKKRKAMINTIGRNARVMTTGGMYATVISADPEGDVIVLRLGNDPGVKVEFSRASILRVVESGDKAKTDN